jgi:hypothetical protein
MKARRREEEMTVYTRRDFIKFCILDDNIFADSINKFLLHHTILLQRIETE